ncbi:hypothetical protein GGS26DRAFT_554317 [Hypomontagnella submonticulosa]|nr:hypothetical protein GGS26DRAFT_554317 [Hypomontagnella submonticulosa]
MDGPVGIAAATVAFAGTLCTSVQTLHEAINSWANAPRTLHELRNGIKAFQDVLASLMNKLKSATEESSPPNQRAAYQDLEPVFQRCQNSCDEFASLLRKITSHSDEDRLSKRDRLRVHLNEKEIAQFRGNLEVYKSTLVVALQHTTV